MKCRSQEQILKLQMYKFSSHRIDHSMLTSKPYIRYSQTVEVKQPDEERLIREIVDSVARQGQKVFDKHRHAMRGAHAKSHGGL